MRTFVKLILPVAAFMLASAGAVSTNVKSGDKPSAILMSGGIHTPSVPCQEVKVNCQVTNTPVVCTAFSQTIYRLDAPNNCPDVLWKTL